MSKETDDVSGAVATPVERPVRPVAEALRLAEWIEDDMTCQGDAEIAAELRRQHAEIERLRGALAAASKGLPCCKFPENRLHCIPHF